MGKVNVNSRNNSQSTIGILDLIDYWTDQSVTTLASPTFNALDVTNSVVIGDDLTVVGNVTIGGSTTVISTEIVQITDNIVELNAEETGAGVTLGSAGLEVNRGSLTPYRIVYEELSADTKIGQVGSLQSLATREDSPLNKGVMVYNSVLKRLDSSQTIELPITFSSSQVTSNSVTGAVKIEGGMGIKGDIFTDGKFNFKGSGSYTDYILIDSSDNFKVSSSNNVDFLLSSGKYINIPSSVYISFDAGTGNKRIYNNGTQFVIENSTSDINLNTISNGNINLQSGTHLRWSPTNDISFDGTDITLNSSGFFKVTPIFKSIDTTASTSSTVGSVLVSGSIAISNTTDAIDSTSGGTITSAGGAAFAKKVCIGTVLDLGDTSETKTQVSGQGLNFRSRSKTVTTSSTNNATFNSIEGGILSTAVVVPIASTMYITGAPTVTGGGSITNSYALLVNSGNSLFNGKIINSDTTASTSSTTGSTLLSGGLSINNTTNASAYNNGGSFTTSGGIAVEKDSYFGGKIDVGGLGGSLTQVSGQGLNFRSRNRTISTSSSVSTTFNSFEGATLNTTVTIPVSSTVYIGSAPSVTGGGILTESYALLVNSGGIRTDDFIYSTLTTASTSSVTGSVRLLGSIAISNTTDATSSVSGGTFSSAGGISVAKKIFVGSSINSTPGTGVSNVNHLNLMTSTLNRFSFGLIDSESGSETGSNFFLSRSNDLGNFVENVISITRSSGVISLPNTTASTSNSVGSILIDGSIAISNITEATSSTNGGTFTSGGGGAFAKSLFVGIDMSVGTDLYVNGQSFLGQVDIDTTDGPLDITGANAVSINVGAASSFKTTTGSITIDSEAGTLVLDGNNGVTIDSLSGISIDSGATSNFTSTGTLTLQGNGLTLSGNTGSTNINGDTGINLTTVSIANGIKIGTTVSGIPITIGHTSSETIVADNLTVSGDLTILGTTTSIESTLITINDNAIVVNNMPSGTSDGGFIVRRYQIPNDLGTGDVVSDTVKETSTFGGNSSGVDTITLNGTASAVNDYYKGWWIKVTSGAGSGQVRRIISYNGTSKVATIYSTLNTNPNGDGLDLSTAITTGDSYNLYDSPYVGMFFDESNKEVAMAGVSFDPSLGEFPTTTSYYPIHADSIIIESSFATSGEAIFDGNILIDSDHTEAILIRKNGDSGDIFAIDSVNGTMKLANPINTIGSGVPISFNQNNSVSGVETYSKIESKITNNVSGNLTGDLIFSVQNDTEGLIPFLTLNGGTSGNSFINISSLVDSLKINNTTASTSVSTGSVLISGSIAISNTTDATSTTSGGTFTSAGGLAIAKKLFVGGVSTFTDSTKISTSLNALTSSSAGMNINGDLGLYNSSNSKIIFNNVSQAVPSFTTRSSGTKLVLRGEISGSSADYAIGNETSAQWYSVPTTAESHVFYLGTTEYLTIDSNGVSILGSGTGIRLDNGSNYSSFFEASDETRFKPHTSGVSKGIVFMDSTNTNSRIRINSDGQLSLGLSGYSGTPSSVGAWFTLGSQTFTDNLTIATGTASVNCFTNLSQSTLAASNLSVTTTDAIGVSFGGAPIRGTNQTFTNAYNVYIDSGSSLTATGTINTASSLYIKDAPFASGVGTITNAYSLFIDDGVSRFDGKIICPTTLQVTDTLNTFTADQASINLSGDLVLKNATKQRIFFNDSGAGTPSFTSRSSGSKIILKPAISASSTDNAIGVDSLSTWYSTTTTSGSHKFYLGNSNRVSFDNTGTILSSSGTGTPFVIRSGTSDGSDDQGIIIAGGGSTGVSRGAQIEIYGNENNSGNIAISTGVSGQITMDTDGVTRMTILDDGTIALTSTTDTTGTGTGSFSTPGGLNVNKSLFVGTNLSLNFNQLYNYSGDVSGRLLVQSKTSSVGSVIRNFTNDGDNTDNNLYEIYGKGTPLSLVDTEFLQVGFSSSTTEYVLKTGATGTGTVRPIVLQTGSNTDQLKLLSTGVISASSTTASTSSSVGSFLLAGSIAISNTTNATSSTNGGTFTSAGGGAFEKDLYVGGSLVTSGGISGGITTPSVTISNETNITGSVLQSKNRNGANGIYRTFSVIFRITPTAASTVTTFEFTVPEVVTNFTTSYDIVAMIQGNYGAGLDPIENRTAYSVSGGTTCLVKFTSSSTSTHIIHCTLKYNI